MDRDEFRIALDQYLDGEMNDAGRGAFTRRANEDPEQGEALRSAERIQNLLRGLDEDVQPPLAAQAAWRRAVRAEAKRQKGRAWRRVASALAASVVLLAGATAAFRATGRITQSGASSATPTGATPTAAAYALEDTAMALSVSGAVVQTDGDAQNGTEKSAPLIAGDAQDAAAAMATPAASERVLVQSAVREMETDEFDQAYELIGDLVDEYGGYFRTNAVQTKDGKRTANMAVSVPRGDLTGFLNAVSRAGSVVRSEDTSSDISGEVYDAKSRLQTLETEKARLNSLIAAANDADELASLKAQLEDVYLSVDALSSRIGSYERQIEDAQVSLTLYEGKAPADVAAGGDSAPQDTSLGGKMAAAFRESGQFLKDMAVSLAIIAPFALLAIALAGIAWAIVALAKKRRRADAQRDQ